MSESMGSLGFWLMVAIGAVVLACLIVMALEWATREVERHVQAALAVEAADHDEPSRAAIEQGWWPLPAVEHTDTPIYAQMRHEEDVWFAASVMADIDDLPGGAA